MYPVTICLIYRIRLFDRETDTVYVRIRRQICPEVRAAAVIRIRRDIKRRDRGRLTLIDNTDKA